MSFKHVELKDLARFEILRNMPITEPDHESKLKDRMIHEPDASDRFDPIVCPACGSATIEAEDASFDHEFGTERVINCSCKCGKTWRK